MKPEIFPPDYDRLCPMQWVKKVQFGCSSGLALSPANYCYNLAAA
jgi:hypothetical protein